ncbi:sensor histidine kinase [Vibrio maerlii]|uniref:sensor histidine kinase n=1 Tax=Vibrio maerlii TaxID=2231648 RepID=UPI000E3CF3F5|nr:HAMP domain-containing sensor histidine kinase [Vibrio maerlii]
MLFSKPRTNNIAAVRKRLLVTYARIALFTAFVVSFSFSLYLVIAEEYRIADHLKSFEFVAERYYQLEQKPSAQISPNITAYYSETELPEIITQSATLEENEVRRIGRLYEEGPMVYYTNFVYNGETIPMYLTIDAKELDFGDENWEVIIILSVSIIAFLLVVLKFSLKRVFDGLMLPVDELSKQLSDSNSQSFSVSKHAIDELKQLADHLNQYTQMKDRVVKQELMFAKYASHELKTPVAVVLGAANLQSMKDDPEFQAKQRARIIGAAEQMQTTIELLLNIVKQENSEQAKSLFPLGEKDISLDKQRSKLTSGVELNVIVEPGMEINMPPQVVNMILKNLVDNAVRFTEQGKIDIEITPNSITVLDTGSGLNEENSTDHGLGLLIIKRLCDTFGWHFELKDREEGTGCVARLRFNPS